jgi:hypothetical protein
MVKTDATISAQTDEGTNYSSKIVNTFDVGRALELGEAYPRGASLK